jgi:TolA-binding protein
MMKKTLMMAFAASLLSGCLKTRNEVKQTEQRQVMQQQVTTMQKANADSSGRLSDIDEQMRYLTGRVEVVENKMAGVNSGLENALRGAQQQNNDQNQRLAILQDALTKMEAQINQLNADIQGIRAEQAGAQAERVAAKAATAHRDSFEAGNEYFAKKDWKKAILNFQKYRDQSPRGKNFAEATYKIGVCFQELGMKDEARTFYDEVLGKFPKSDQARKAKTRLKSLKK